MILTIFHELRNFYATRLRILIIDTDPDPRRQNDVDPDLHHWMMLYLEEDGEEDHGDGGGHEHVPGEYNVGIEKTIHFF